MARHYLSHFATRPFGSTEVQRYHQSVSAAAGDDHRRMDAELPGRSLGATSPCRGCPPNPRFGDAAGSDRAPPYGSVPNQLTIGAPTPDRTWPTLSTGSFYARPLRRFWNYFSTDQILVLQYERCIVEPLSQLAVTYRFLGLDGDHRPADISPPIREAALPPLDADATARLVDIYAADVEELVAMVPTLDLSLWPNFA